jgi:hypothetical protein
VGVLFAKPGGTAGNFILSQHIFWDRIFYFVPLKKGNFYVERKNPLQNLS